MEVVLRYENDVQVDDLTVVDFTMLYVEYVVCLTFFCSYHAVVTIVSPLIVGILKSRPFVSQCFRWFVLHFLTQLLLSSRVSLLVINFY